MHSLAIQQSKLHIVGRSSLVVLPLSQIVLKVYKSIFVLHFRTLQILSKKQVCLLLAHLNEFLLRFAQPHQLFILLESPNARWTQDSICHSLTGEGT